MALRSAELKRDMEKMIMDNVAKSAGSTTVPAGTAGAETSGSTSGSSAARVTAGLGAWVGTNYHTLGTGGAAAACTGDGSDTTTAASSTGALTEAGVKQVIKECFDSGGKPTKIMLGSSQKQTMSGLAGASGVVAPLRGDVGKGSSPASMMAAIDIYTSDFGTFQIIPNRFQRSVDVWFLDMEFWSLAFLRSFQTVDLAKTGDSERQMMVVEYGLRSKNEAASGLLTDIT